MIDSNGNTIAFQTNQITDTLGRGLIQTIVQPPPGDTSRCVSSHAIASTAQYQFPGPNGVSSTVKVCYANITLAPSFSQPNVQAFVPVSALKIVTVILPDGHYWEFDYDAYGNFSAITLPTGGAISYVWQEVGLPVCNDGSFTKVSRAVPATW